MNIMRTRRLRTYHSFSEEFSVCGIRRNPFLEGTSRKKVICFECQKSRHYKFEFPKLRNQKKETKNKKKSLITWDNLEESSNDDEYANMELMTNMQLYSDSNNEIEVFFNLSRNDLITALKDFLNKNKSMFLKLIILRKSHID